jgi:hypothetical protein
MKDFFYSIPDWVWWLLGGVFVVQWLANFVSKRSSNKLDVVVALLENINGSLIKISSRLDKLDRLDQLDQLERLGFKLDDVERALRNLDKLDELDWWSKDKTTFATELFDRIEKLDKG